MPWYLASLIPPPVNGPHLSLFARVDGVGTLTPQEFAIPGVDGAAPARAHHGSAHSEGGETAAATPLLRLMLLRLTGGRGEAAQEGGLLLRHGVQLLRHVFP